MMTSILTENPVLRNLLAAVATMVYVNGTVRICAWAISHGLLAPKVSRKCIHMAAGAWIVFWPLFSNEHWTWRLNILVPFVYSIQLFIKGAVLRNPNDVDVQSMTRTGDPKELLNGPIFFAIVMDLVGLFCFRQRIGVVIMSCLGFGDGIAPLVGYYLPFGSYPTYPFGEDDKKTLSGTLGFVVASVMGYFLMRFVVDDDNSGSDSLMDAEGRITNESMLMLGVATIAAITEGICGPFDNVFVALSAALAYQFLMAEVALS